MKKAIRIILTVIGGLIVLLGLFGLTIGEYLVPIIIILIGCAIAAPMWIIYLGSEERRAEKAEAAMAQEEFWEKRRKEEAERRAAVDAQKERINRLKMDAENAGVVCCPRCGSTSVVPYRKPWNWMLAVIGCLLIFVIGILLGLIGKGGYNRCAKCGHIWKP